MFGLCEARLGDGLSADRLIYEAWRELEIPDSGRVYGPGGLLEALDLGQGRVELPLGIPYVEA